MIKTLTMNEQERKEFLKRPLGKALLAVSTFLDNVKSEEGEITFQSEEWTFVLAATKKKTRDSKKSYMI